MNAECGTVRPIKKEKGKRKKEKERESPHLTLTLSPPIRSSFVKITEDRWERRGNSDRMEHMSGQQFNSHRAFHVAINRTAQSV
jgi:hypothetical protein